jgi:uncharacterized membrane protein YciS (DUF1049 family)
MLLRINKILLVILLMPIAITLSAQEKQNCNATLHDGYIQDGREYSLILEEGKTGKVYLSFFEGFQYRLLICSNNSKKYKIALYDIEKKLLFSGTCEDYSKSFDLRFKSNIACVAIISISVNEVADPKFTIVVGFKETQAEKNIK